MESKEEGGIQNYWDKADPEEETINPFDKSIQERYSKLDLIYKSLIPDDRIDEAISCSKKEREKLEIKEQDYFVYGEITFRTHSYIYETIKRKFGDNILKGNFIDLGSVGFLLIRDMVMS
jgi:hypothetical protein